MNIEILSDLISIASDLDKKGLTKEADIIDRVVIAAAGSRPLVPNSGSVTFRFKPGKSEVDMTAIDPQTEQEMVHLASVIQDGMINGSQDFIKIEVGTSGTDSFETNNQVMHQRITSALKILAEFLNKGGNVSGGPGGGNRGWHHLSFTPQALRERSAIMPKMNTIGPGGTVGGIYQAPKDPNDPFFESYQYITIRAETNNPPDYGQLATEMRKQVDEVTPNYIGTPAGSSVFVLDSLEGILSELRNEEDFYAFDKEFEKQYGKKFHDAACDGMLGTVPATITLPLLGTVNIPKMLQGGVGPDEIGENAPGINAHLRRLKQPSIVC